MPFKRCSRCFKLKDQRRFSKSSSSKDGLNAYCKVCDKRRKRPKQSLEQKRAWYRANRENLRRKLLLKKYGITQEQYNTMFVEQGGVCAICTEPENRTLCVDHCHTTGHVRALLCSRCNYALGFLRDNPELCTKMHDYLKKHE